MHIHTFTQLYVVQIKIRSTVVYPSVIYPIKSGKNNKYTTTKHCTMQQ